MLQERQRRRPALGAPPPPRPPPLWRDKHPAPWSHNCNTSLTPERFWKVSRLRSCRRRHTVGDRPAVCCRLCSADTGQTGAVGQCEHAGRREGQQHPTPTPHTRATPARAADRHKQHVSQGLSATGPVSHGARDSTQHHPSRGEASSHTGPSHAKAGAGDDFAWFHITVIGGLLVNLAVLSRPTETPVPPRTCRGPGRRGHVPPTPPPGQQVTSQAQHPLETHRQGQARACSAGR